MYPDFHALFKKSRISLVGISKVTTIINNPILIHTILKQTITKYSFFHNNVQFWRSSNISKQRQNLKLETNEKGRVPARRNIKNTNISISSPNADIYIYPAQTMMPLLSLTQINSGTSECRINITPPCILY